jgi:hypothetical protein
MTEMVLVGCKLPHGLILELLDPIKPGEDFMKPHAAGKQVTIKGACSLYNQVDKKSRSHFQYAITPVDKAFFDEWYRRNKDLDCVRNGLIFVTEKQSIAEGLAKERVDVKTGLEPLAQQDDPRMKRAEPNPAYVEPI